MALLARMLLLASATILAGAAAAQDVIPGLIPKSSDPVMGPGKHLVTTPHPLEQYTPVTDAVLRNPDINDWIMMRGNYEGYGHSKLSQLNKGNVKNLQLVWSRIMESGVNICF